MDAANWLEFSTYSDKYYHDHNYKQYDKLSANKHNLNILWIKIKEVLINTANKTVPCSFRSSEDNIPKPKSLTTCYTALFKLNHILLKFRMKLINKSLWPDAQEWARSAETVQQILKDYQIDLVSFPDSISTDNVRSVKKQLLVIYKLIYHKARLEKRHIE